VDLNDTPEQAEYRAQARAWLEANREQAPPRSGSYEASAYIDSRRAWQRRLAEAGLAAVTWPTEFGGRGLGRSSRSPSTRRSPGRGSRGSST
jgi:alkylation response protein AidB-like acyl-CoA dehydrogenase